MAIDDDKAVMSRVVSAKLDNDLFDFVENYRWENRKTKTEIVTDAITQWAVSKGYTMPTDGARTHMPHHGVKNPA